MWEVWLDNLGDLGETLSPSACAALVYRHADGWGIPREIALPQIRQESGCKTTVCSSAGACGIAQFTPGTAARFGLVNRNDPEASMDAWGEYMTWLLDRYSWDYAKALAGYNAGEGNVDKAVARCGSNWLACMPRNETRNYVATILGNAGSFDTPTQPGGGVVVGQGGDPPSGSDQPAGSGGDPWPNVAPDQGGGGAVAAGIGSGLPAWALPAALVAFFILLARG